MPELQRSKINHGGAGILIDDNAWEHNIVTLLWQILFEMCE